METGTQTSLATFDSTDQHLMLELARQSIAHGFRTSSPAPVHLDRCPPTLQQVRACFVTLQMGGQLRGCIGSLQPTRPLAVDVAANAFAAAFRDPRFAPLGEYELPLVDIHISVLTPAQLMTFTSEQDLLNQLRPGVDGLILEDAGRRSTFLPAVWDQLPTPPQFLAQLKRKAGLPTGHWSPTVQVWRYEAISVPAGH